MEITPPEPTPPQSLHSAFHDGPFRNCDACGRDLFESLVPYAVSKAWRGDEVVFETALCAVCLAALIEEFSEESRERLASQRNELLQSLRSASANDPDEESGRRDRCCAKCGVDYDQSDTEIAHGVMGYLVGGTELIPTLSVCDPCSESDEDLLSWQTRETYDQFMERTFPGIPKELDLPGLAWGGS